MTSISACSRCGEKYFRETFMRVDCVNPSCVNFSVDLMHQWIAGPPRWTGIDAIGWTDTHYLGRLPSSGEDYDLWRATILETEYFIARYGPGLTDEIVEDTEQLSSGLSNWAVVEAGKRWSYLVKYFTRP